jgi:hypothetical protein
MEMRLLDEIVGQALSGDIYLADHVFNDNGRMGVIGSIYRPVLADEYVDATSDEGLQRHLARWWNDARRRGDARGIGEFAAALYAEKGSGIIWDEGDAEKARRVREYTGLSVTDAPIFTCCGGGMCISRRIGWARVADPGRLFRLLDLERGRIEAWEYFVNCE